VVPVHWDDLLVGAVAVFTHAEDGTERLGAREKVITELGSFAESLVGRQVAVRREREATHARLRKCIDELQFRTVYQPVVHLPTGNVCGYEALTRFDHGDDPESTFAQAYTVGLGPELEAACVRRALEGSESLPQGPWVSVNLSPAAVLDGRAAPLLRHARRQIVVEVTERSAIQDYVEFRRALDAMPGVWTSIDDAGAAYASLRHILELRPEIVKLDAALVRNIDTDPARQGLAAGLSHFAAQIGTRLVGEGIETAEESDTLQRLGVLHGQGLLYGAPAPPPSSAA
jgi:EAL domain-containing protein (putative c-di-GMP-specific phosphodiesterase class I)